MASSSTPCEKKNKEKKVFSLFGLMDCSSEKFPGCFIQKCLDTTITWKLVGMLVVSLFGFALVIVLNTTALHKINNSNHSIRDVSIPQYKIGQYVLRGMNGFKISLIHILDADELDEDDINVLANQQRLEDMAKMIVSLRDGGPVIDVARISRQTLDVFTVTKADDPMMIDFVNRIYEAETSLEESFDELVECLSNDCLEEEKEDVVWDVYDSLGELYDVVIAMTVEVNKRNELKFEELEDIIAYSMERSLWVGLMIATILVIATLLYILVIVHPLRTILEKITFIARGGGDLAQRIEVKSNDEVGQLAQQLNTLVDSIYSLNSFKAVIEEEESTTEVNLRLANVLRERFDCDNFFIYERTGNKNNMSVAYAEDMADLCSPEILDESSFCRAKRTGHTISSRDFPEICKKFPHGDRLEHHCIPMIASGKVVGVVQFLHEKDTSAEEYKEFSDKVKRATRYVKEATPVIEAKRFASALHESTMRDPMTDLYNRRFLESYTETLVASTNRRNTKVGILMCDMDFFKEVNDNYGHETGDVVLIKTAEVLTGCVRASDMVIRYGGEEFIILLIDVKNRQEILDLAERIRSTMEGTIINVPDGTLQKTLSIGASEFPGDTDGFWEAIKFADVALYRAKEEGRNRVISFSSEMWKGDKY